MILPIFHHPSFQAELVADHRFPMGKYGLIASYLREAKLILNENFLVSQPIEFDQAVLAHDADYVGQVFQSRVDPKVEKAIGFGVSHSIALRARMSCAATLMAARQALKTGIATSTAGGSHHAGRRQGAGFCVFNDVAIAAANLLASSEIGQALVFDCDVHQGDGTADIFANSNKVFTISIHGENNYPHPKRISDLDINLPDGTTDPTYLDALKHAVHAAKAAITPDIVFYNAGVDPHADDRLGRLALSDEGLRNRDRLVIDHFRQRGIPVVAVQGGGYSKDIEAVAKRHTIIHHTALEFV